MMKLNGRSHSGKVDNLLTAWSTKYCTYM